MRFRSMLSAFAVAATVVTSLPAHAADETEIQFGTPIVDFRYNDGEVGTVALAFGPSATRRSGSTERPTQSDCTFATEASVGTSAVTLDIVAYAYASPFVDSAGNAAAPVSVGVKCTVTDGAGHSFTVNAALPGAAGTATGRHTFVQYSTPVTVCSIPTVHWSDNVVQTKAAPGFCKTS